MYTYIISILQNSSVQNMQFYSPSSHIWILHVYVMAVQSEILLYLHKIVFSHMDMFSAFLKGLYQGSGFCSPCLPRSWWTLTAPAALLITVNFNLSDTPSAQDNLSKLLTALSRLALLLVPTPFDLCTFLARVSALEVALGGECGEQLW